MINENLFAEIGLLVKALLSNHEGQVNVLDSVTDITRAINGCVASVEAVVAGPELTA